MADEPVITQENMPTVLGYIRADVSDIKKRMETDYVTQKVFDAKFDPIRKIVYGLVGLIFTGLGAIIVKWVVGK